VFPSGKSFHSPLKMEAIRKLDFRSEIDSRIKWSQDR
jgi:hypothetical protein